MTGYELSRKWFDFCFDNPEKINPNHTALYFFCVEHCNRLGWKEKFGLPTTMAKEAIGIKSYNTYIKTLRDLIEFGFIIMIEVSKNQYSSNIIALSNFNKALDTPTEDALSNFDKALIKHTSKQGESTQQSIDSINKLITINNKPITEYFPNFKSDEFIKAFNDYIIMRRSNGKIADVQICRLVSKLQTLTKIETQAIEIINNSLNAGYPDFYPLKQKKEDKKTIDDGPLRPMINTLKL